MFPKLTFSWGKKKSSDCEQTKATVNDRILLTSSISDVSVWYVAHGVRYYNNNTEGALLFAGGREPPGSNKVAVRLSGNRAVEKLYLVLNLKKEKQRKNGRRSAGETKMTLSY